MDKKNDRQPAKILPEWAVTLIVIAVFDIFLAFEYCCIVKISSPVWSFCGLLVAVDLLIWGILSVSFSERASSVMIIGEEELRNAMRLLRYATAILSFLSLMTTASGMRSFVFDTDWKAYLGSFAVQSILVVFSLLLCHFYVMIGSIPYFGKAVKALMLSLLTIFFTVALVVSSCFSYVYISGNAYKNTWPEDSETLIREYLLREAAELKERNTFLGEQFLKNIVVNIQGTLEGDIKIYLEKKRSEVSEDISNFQLAEYTNVQENLAKIDIAATVERLGSDKRSRPAQLEEIRNSYNTIGRDVLQHVFINYNNVVAEVSILVTGRAGDEEATLEEISEKLEKISGELQGIINRVDGAINDVGSLTTNFYVNDIKPIKAVFSSTAATFRDFVQEQKDALDDLIVRAGAEDNDTTNSGETSVVNQIETIRRQIYLLDPRQSDLKSKIQNIDGSLSGLLDKFSESDVVTTESIASLTSLIERINEYGKSLSLSNDIQVFMENDLGEIYSFDESGEDEKEVWRLTRGEDFHQFQSMLHDLPDPLYLEKT